MSVVSLNGHILHKIEAAIDAFLANELTLSGLWAKTKLPDNLINSNPIAQEYYDVWLNIEVIYILNQGSLELEEEDAISLLETIATLQGILTRLINQVANSNS